MYMRTVFGFSKNIILQNMVVLTILNRKYLYMLNIPRKSACDNPYIHIIPNSGFKTDFKTNNVLIFT